ncbi:MAG: hypothetical protein ACXVCP_02290 [Bdellovibrio sp.]
MKAKFFFNLTIFSSTALLSSLAIADEACQSQRYMVLSACTEYPKIETVLNNALECGLVNSNWKCSVQFPLKRIETIYLPYTDRTLRKETNLDPGIFIVREAYTKEDVIAQIRKDIQAQIEKYGCKK